jgi:hypothetical protein
MTPASKMIMDSAGRAVTVMQGDLLHLHVANQQHIVRLLGAIMVVK